MKTQVIVIHGGDTFDTYEDYIAFLKDFPFELEKAPVRKWKDELGEVLGDGFEVIRPMMPNKFNAKYPEWKIWFEKHIPFFDDEVIFVGHSLGGIFLAKYLSENTYPKKIKATFLVAAPFDDADSEYSLASFALPSSLSRFGEQGGRIFAYHSSDDDVVPFVDLEKYKKALPSLEVIPLTGYGHFSVESFPELEQRVRAM